MTGDNYKMNKVRVLNTPPNHCLATATPQKLENAILEGCHYQLLLSETFKSAAYSVLLNSLKEAEQNLY